MKLRELLAAVPSISFDAKHPALDAEVKGLSTNSHACKSGDLFLGMPGTRVDGGDFWQSAIESGALAALISTQAAEKTPPPKLGEPRRGSLRHRSSRYGSNLRSNSNRILRQSS